MRWVWQPAQGRRWALASRPHHLILGEKPVSIAVLDDERPDCPTNGSGQVANEHRRACRHRRHTRCSPGCLKRGNPKANQGVSQDAFSLDAASGLVTIAQGLAGVCGACSGLSLQVRALSGRSIAQQRAKIFRTCWIRTAGSCEARASAFAAAISRPTPSIRKCGRCATYGSANAPIPAR